MPVLYLRRVCRNILDRGVRSRRAMLEACCSEMYEIETDAQGTGSSSGPSPGCHRAFAVGCEEAQACTKDRSARRVVDFSDVEVRFMF